MGIAVNVNNFVSLFALTHWRIGSWWLDRLSLSDRIMCPWLSPLIKVTTWHLYGVKPLPRLMLTFSQMELLISLKFESKWKIFLQENVLENVVCHKGSVYFKALSWKFFIFDDVKTWNILCQIKTSLRHKSWWLKNMGLRCQCSQQHILVFFVLNL